MTDRSFLSVIVFCIRNPLIFHGVSPAAMIYELMRCFAAYQFSTHSQSVDFPRKINHYLISYQKKEKDNSKTASFSFRKTMSFYF